MRAFWVYIASSKGRILYVGVTNDLRRRMDQHKSGRLPEFTRRYNIDRLVYFEQTPDVVAAIEREKQIKKWRRQKKVGLVESINPEWRDLSSFDRDAVADPSSLRSSG
jgi:putative endonuclease